MKLNRVEKALMNNPVRALVQRRHEAALMERFGGRVEGGRVLEIGCGRGVGTEIIFERFGVREVHAFDVDPDMIARARRRLSGYPANHLSIFVGDAAAIKAEDASYDAVFDFGIIQRGQRQMPHATANDQEPPRPQRRIVRSRKLRIGDPA